MEASFYKERLEAVRKILALNQLDGILFNSLENIRYLCGFTGSDGACIITRNDSLFLTDSRYWTQAEQEVGSARIIHYKKKMEDIVSLLLDLKLNRIGFESVSLPYSFYQFLSLRLENRTTLSPLGKELKYLRAVKDHLELNLIRKAVEISSNAFHHMMERLQEGVVEEEMALGMEFFMRNNGADAIGFDIIIASGKRAALPHGKASGKRIERGDLIVIDFGSGFQGYHSDQTRTVVCGNPSPEQIKIHQIVKEAHDKAIEMIHPGVPIREIDAAARDHIKNHGYGEYFGHGTGHGIGLAVHEEPGVHFDNQDLTQEGMVFTIEPGIYLPDRGGVRIEDMVLVTSHGAEVLTYLPVELTQI